MPVWEGSFTEHMGGATGQIQHLKLTATVSALKFAVYTELCLNSNIEGL